MSEDRSDPAAHVVANDGAAAAFDADVVAIQYRESLLGEIERDVRDRRRGGFITEEFEADLDGAWAEVSPYGASGGGFESVADQAARHAIVDYDAPILGSKPLRLVKRAVKLLTAWYLIFVGRQLVAFAGTALRAMRILARRVDVLERNTPTTDPRVQVALLPVEHDLDVSVWVGEVVAAIETAVVSGRVVHLDCASGVLVAALAARSIDVYGIDPRPDAGGAADVHNVEVRRDSALAHLRKQPTGVLRAVVLSGCVDRLPLGDQLELIEASVAATHPQGVVVLLGSNPQASSVQNSPLVRDLAVGRPLHAETWVHLLQRSGMFDVGVSFAATSIPDEIALNSDPAMLMLAEKVYAPTAFCIVARK